MFGTASWIGGVCLLGTASSIGGVCLSMEGLFSGSALSRVGAFLLMDGNTSSKGVAVFLIVGCVGVVVGVIDSSWAGGMRTGLVVYQRPSWCLAISIAAMMQPLLFLNSMDPVPFLLPT